MAGIYYEEKERNSKDKEILPTGGGEATSWENMEGLYVSVWSKSTGEEDELLFPVWNEVDE